MKKILFCCYGLGLGGIEKCFVNLLNILPEDQYDVDVLLMNPEYELKNEIKRKINWIDSFSYVMNTTDTMHQIREHGGILRNLPVFLRYCFFRIDFKLRLHPWKIFRSLKQKYDIAIAYSQNDFSPYYVIDKVRASKKLFWYHNGAYKRNEREYRRDKEYYSKFDSVVAVSDDCRKMLLEKFDFKENQLVVLKNVCDAQNIITKSEAFLPEKYDKQCINIVTVGRLTKEKGADLAIEACKKLYDDGYPIKWHWVGDGNQHNAIQNMIHQLNLEDSFILEGNQINPYPFIKNADIYVQPSYFEAFSTTVTEAKVLRRPLVVTDVGGMRDQIEDGVNGSIVPIDAESIYKAIKELIDHKELSECFINALSQVSWDKSTFLDAYKESVLE